MVTVPVSNSNSNSAEENAMVADYFTRIERKTVAFNPVTKAKLKAKLASRWKSGPMPWADIIITLVEYKLAGMPTIEWEIEADAKSDSEGRQGREASGLQDHLSSYFSAGVQQRKRQKHF